MQTITSAQLSGTMRPSYEGNKITIPISLDKIATYINRNINHINALQTRVTELKQTLNEKVAELKSIDNQNYQALYNRSAAWYRELVAKDEALQNSLTQESNNRSASLQAQEVRLNGHDGHIRDVQQRQVAANNSTAVLQVQLNQEAARVNNLQASLQQAQANAVASQNRIAQLEATNQQLSRKIDEDQREQANLKQTLSELTKTIQKMSLNFEAFQDKAKATQEEQSLKIAQLNNQVAEQQANIVLMRKLAADMVQEEQPAKEESQRKQGLNNRGLVRANSAKLLSKKL